jgi:hypothetical protein
MSHPSQILSLKSDGVGTLLVLFLWLSLDFKILILLDGLLHMIAPDIYTSSEIRETFAFIYSILQLPLHIITIILFLTWMYLLHKDLNMIFRTYPITPGQSLAQLMIPFYNLRGICNVFSILGERLRRCGGKALRYWLPLLYVTGFASAALNEYLDDKSSNKGAVISSTLLLTTLGVHLFLTIIWLEMTRLIRKSVDYRAKEERRRPCLMVRPR